MLGPLCCTNTICSSLSVYIHEKHESLTDKLTKMQWGHQTNNKHIQKEEEKNK